MAVCTRAVIKVTPRADALLALVSTITILFAGPDALSMQEPAYSLHNRFHSGCVWTAISCPVQESARMAIFAVLAGYLSAPNVTHGNGEDSPGVYWRMKPETAAIKEVLRFVQSRNARIEPLDAGTQAAAVVAQQLRRTRCYLCLPHDVEQ
jgi:hypothetical protein